MEYMLPKEHRLRLERDFKQVFAHGKGVASPFFVVKWLYKGKKDDTGALPPRFGFVVGGNVAKLATVRNRLKRQMREAVHLMLKNGFVAPNFDMVIVAKRGAIGKKYQEIKEDMDRLLRRTRLI